MTAGVQVIDANATVQDAAALLANADIGSLPVCSADGRVHGMVTDRDIVTKVVAQGRQPSQVTVGELTDQPELITVGADNSVDEAIEMMKQHKVRRLPVIDGNQVVGMVSQADIARALSDRKVGDLLAVISS